MLLCFLAARLVHGLGLVSIFGRLWPINLQIPESEPSHCFGFTREVSGCCYPHLLIFCFCFPFTFPLNLFSFVVDIAVQSLQGVGAFYLSLISLVFSCMFSYFQNLSCSVILKSGHNIPSSNF